MPASKTVAREFVDSVFKPKPLFGAFRLSVLKGNDLAPEGLLDFHFTNPSCGGLTLRRAVGAKHLSIRMGQLSGLNVRRSILRLG